jgi:hypothetical protein
MVFTCLLAAASVAAEQPSVKNKENAKLEAEQNEEWLAAVERIRALPRPCEIKNMHVTASVTQVYDLTDAAKAQIKKALDEYDAELLKRAARWLDEEKSLRQEYEAKALQALPEDKREAARKLLDYSHGAWTTLLDREAPFKKEYAERTEKIRQGMGKISTDDLEAARTATRTWVKDYRAKLTKGDEEVIQKLQGMLSAEEAERLSQFVRMKVGEPPEKK